MAAPDTSATAAMTASRASPASAGQDNEFAQAAAPPVVVAIAQTLYAAARMNMILVSVRCVLLSPTSHIV